MKEFSAQDLHAYLTSTQEKPLLLDVREPWEYEKARIEGSILIPMRTIPAKVSELAPDNETVVICHHGVRSMAVCRFLENQGFSNLINLNGGIAAWARDVDKGMTTY